MRNVLITIFFLSSLSLASNGTYFIGVSPVSKSLGGTGVANPTVSVDAAFKNPAILSELPMQKGDFEADATVSMLKQNSTAENTSLGEKSTKAPAIFVPAFSAAFRAKQNLSVAFSAFTYGGAKQDYSGESTLQELKVDSSVSYIGPSVSYKFIDNWSVGISPHLVYADLAINNKNALVSTTQTNRPPHGVLGYGLKLGTAYTPIKDLTLGLTFSPKVRLRYKEVADLDALNLLPAASGGTSGRGDGNLDDVDSEDPAQVALGVAYMITPAIKVTLDGRFIGWSSADVFRELGWRDQYVLAIGGQYKLNKISLRAGFNYTRSVIDSASGESGFSTVTVSGHTVSQQSISNLNLVGFPGFSSTNLCIGGGYEFSPKISGDLSFVYAPTTTITRSGTGATPAGTAGAYSYTGKVAQWSLSLGGTYRF